jgi:type IV pilus assembly protein PilV
MMKTHLKPHQRGASLIEILVAVLIVTFGILAMAALQANSVRYNKTSELRTVASLLAKDIADRMRANVKGVQDGNYNIKDANYATAASLVANAALGNKPTCAAADENCTTIELAAIDLSEWRKNLFFGLPQTAAYIQYNAAAITGGGEFADLWVVWDDSAASGGGAAVSTDVKNCPPWPATDKPPTYNCLYMRVAL